MSLFLKVLSAMVVGGQIAKPGEVVEVTESEARMLVRLKKAEPVDPVEPVEQTEPAEPVDPVELVASSSKKKNR